MTDNHERCVGRAKIRRRPDQIISRIANRMANMSLGIFYGFQRGVFLQALNWKTFLLMSSFPKPPLSDLCAKRDYSITSFFGNVFVLHKVGKPAQKKTQPFSCLFTFMTSEQLTPDVREPLAIHPAWWNRGSASPGLSRRASYTKVCLQRHIARH